MARLNQTEKNTTLLNYGDVFVPSIQVLNWRFSILRWQAISMRNRQRTNCIRNMLQYMAKNLNRARFLFFTIQIIRGASIYTARGNQPLFWGLAG